MQPLFSFRCGSPLVFAAYFIVALALTFSLLIVGNTALVGSQYGGAVGLWSTWWPSHAFATNQNLAFSDYFLYPIRTNIFPLLSLPLTAIYLPLAALFKPFLGYHLLLLLCLWLNAVSGYLFLRQRSDAVDLPAFYGGLIIAFNPLTWLFASRGELALLAIFPLLWALISWKRLIEQPDFRHTLLLVASLYVTVLTSIQFWNLLLTCWLLYALWTLPKQKAPLYDWLLLGGLMLLGGIAFYPLSNLLWSSYVPLYPAIEVWQGATTFNSAIWIALVVVGIVLRRIALAFPGESSLRGRLWLVLTGLHVVLFAAPQFAPLSLLGIPSLPFLSQPLIFLLPVIIAVAAISVEAFHLYSNRVPLVTGRQIIIPALVLIVLSGWWIPLPRTPLPDANLYTALAADPENYTVIDFPMGVDSLENHYRPTAAGESDSTFAIAYRAGLTMAYVPWHGKRVVGGVANSLNGADLTIYRDSTLAQLAGFIEPSSDKVTTAQQLRQELASWRVGYIIIHPEDGDAAPLRQYLTWTGTFCPVAKENGTQLWRARWHPAGCPDYQIDIGSAEDELALGAGWYTAEAWPEQSIRWAGSTANATLSLWTVAAADYKLVVRASAPGVADQSVEVWANGEQVGTFAPRENWEVFTFTLSGSTIQAGGPVNIELRHQTLIDRDGRTLAAAYDFVALNPAEDS